MQPHFNLDLKFNQIQSKAESDNRHIYAIATFAKNPSEATTISRKIIDLYNRNIDSNVIVIDCSRTLFSDNKFDEWVDNSAQAAYYQGKIKAWQLHIKIMLIRLFLIGRQI